MELNDSFREKMKIYNIKINLHKIDFRDLIIQSSYTIQQTNDTVHYLRQKNNDIMFEKDLLYFFIFRKKNTEYEIEQRKAEA